MTDELAVEHGAFTTEFAKKKNWKLDRNLLEALVHTIPEGYSVIELGAGIGRYVEALRSYGYTATGLDGIHGIEQLSGGLVKECDLAADDFPVAPRSSSCAICIETAEHVPPDMERLFWENVCSVPSGMLVVSVAIPGQRGHNHVNCRTPEHVVYMVTLQVQRWSFNEVLTLKAREIAGKGWDRKLLIFTR